MNTLATGPVFSILDLVIPTILGVIIFRYPVKQLIDTARHFVRLLFDGLLAVLQKLSAPPSVIHEVRGWETPAVDHWQIIWLVVMILYGTLTIYLVALVSYMVLNQIPEQTLARQKAA